MSSPRRSDPSRRELITADHVDRILTTLLDTYDQVVVDTGSGSTSGRCAAFEHAESVLFVDQPGDRGPEGASHALVEYLNEAGTVAAKSMFVLNNMFGREILKPRDVETGARARGSRWSCRTTRSST